MSSFTEYQVKEVFEILRINQKVWSKLDENVEDREIYRDTTIHDWRITNDLVEWSDLYKVENDLFNLTLTKEDWFKAILPEKKKTVWELCEFIAQHAKKEVVKPIKVFGIECLSASIFRALKRDLLARGLEVKNLRPSSPLSDFTDFQTFPKLVAEISKRGVSISDSVKLKHKKGLSFFQRNNIFNPDRFYIDTGSLRTFRDLTQRILEVTKAA